MRILAFIFLLFQSLVFCQTGSKSSYGFYIQPHVGRVFKHKNMPIGEDSVSNKLGVSGGFNYNLKLSEKVVLRTGIAYGFINCVSNQTGLILGSDIDPQQGYISESRLESKIQFHEINLPICFQFKVFKGFHINLGLEISKAFADNSSRTIYSGNGEKETLEVDNILLLNGAPQLSIMYEFPLKNNSFMSVEPFYKLYARPYLFNDVGMYNFGLRLNYGWSK
ncbi:MAG: PorT family protein [Flavobacteriales bacterium]|nr:PorT family protein [Flavobacteriales bacterium]